MNTFSNGQNCGPIDMQKMLVTMREFEAKGRFLDALRDVAFEDMRAHGFYIKAERDSLGEYWVVDDRLLEKFNRPPRHPRNPYVDVLSGIRVTPLSCWRPPLTSDSPPGKPGNTESSDVNTSR